MNDMMEVTKTLLGLSMAVSSLMGVVVFPIDKKLMQLFVGPIPCAIIGIFVYFVRFLLTSLIENPWYILPVQSLHAFSFILLWSGAIAHTNKISSKRISTSMFSLLNATHFSISYVIGAPLGGFLYQPFGGRVLFRYSAYFMLLWTLFMIFLFYRKRIFNGGEKKKPGEEVSLKKDEESCWGDWRIFHGKKILRILGFFLPKLAKLGSPKFYEILYPQR